MFLQLFTQLPFYFPLLSTIAQQEKQSVNAKTDTAAVQLVSGAVTGFTSGLTGIMVHVTAQCGLSLSLFPPPLSLLSLDLYFVGLSLSLDLCLSLSMPSCILICLSPLCLCLSMSVCLSVSLSLPPSLFRSFLESVERC